MSDLHDSSLLFLLFHPRNVLLGLLLCLLQLVCGDILENVLGVALETRGLIVLALALLLRIADLSKETSAFKYMQRELVEGFGPKRLLVRSPACWRFCCAPFHSLPLILFEHHSGPLARETDVLAVVQTFLTGSGVVFIEIV